VACGGEFGIDFDEEATGGLGLPDHGGGGLEFGLVSDADQEVGEFAGLAGDVEFLYGDGFVGPDDGGAEPMIADGAFGAVAEVEFLGFVGAVNASGPPEAAVDFHQSCGAGGLVEAVDILGDEEEFFEQVFHFGQGVMGGRWSGGFDELFSPVVFLPDLLGIGEEEFHRGRFMEGVGDG